MVGMIFVIISVPVKCIAQEQTFTQNNVTISAKYNKK